MLHLVYWQYSSCLHSVWIPLGQQIFLSQSKLRTHVLHLYHSSTVESKYIVIYQFRIMFESLHLPFLPCELSSMNSSEDASCCICSCFACASARVEPTLLSKCSMPFEVWYLQHFAHPCMIVSNYITVFEKEISTNPFESMMFALWYMHWSVSLENTSLEDHESIAECLQKCFCGYKSVSSFTHGLSARRAQCSFVGLLSPVLDKRGSHSG